MLCYWTNTQVFDFPEEIQEGRGHSRGIFRPPPPLSYFSTQGPIGPTYEHVVVVATIYCFLKFDVCMAGGTFIFLLLMLLI